MTVQALSTSFAGRISEAMRKQMIYQAAQAVHHEKAMKLQPGTPERNTANGLVASYMQKAEIQKHIRFELAAFAKEIGVLNEYDIASATSRGKQEP